MPVVRFRSRKCAGAFSLQNTAVLQEHEPTSVSNVGGGGHVIVVDEPLYAGANGALQLALDMPGEYWQQLR